MCRSILNFVLFATSSLLLVLGPITACAIAFYMLGALLCLVIIIEERNIITRSETCTFPLSYMFVISVLSMFPTHCMWWCLGATLLLFFCCCFFMEDIEEHSSPLLIGALVISLVAIALYMDVDKARYTPYETGVVEMTKDGKAYVLIDSVKYVSVENDTLKLNPGEIVEIKADEYSVYDLRKQPLCEDEVVLVKNTFIAKKVLLKELGEYEIPWGLKNARNLQPGDHIKVLPIEGKVLKIEK